jgi:hypothetical protein
VWEASLIGGRAGHRPRLPLRRCRDRAIVEAQPPPRRIATRAESSWPAARAMPGKTAAGPRTCRVRAGACGRHRPAGDHAACGSHAGLREVTRRRS